MPLFFRRSKSASLDEFIRRRELTPHHPPAPENPAAREIRLFSVMRNESLRLPYFLRHHRSLGVDRMFIVDHSSTDDTARLLQDEPDVHLYTARGPFRNKMPWLRSLLCHFGRVGWSLVLDADEILMFPGQGDMGLSDLCRRLERRGFDALRCFTLDMYPGGDLAEAAYVAGEDPRSAAPFFDRGSSGTMDHRWSDGSVSEDFLDVGGVRKRVFGLNYVCLTKFPLLMFHPRMRLGLGMHVVENMRPTDMQGALLHFKFLQDFSDRVREEEGRKAYWRSGREYAAYSAALGRSGSLRLRDAESIRHRGEAQLLDLGIMKHSPTLEADRRLEFMVGRTGRNFHPDRLSVSVVVRTRTADEGVFSLLLAVAKQDLKPLEIVVIDSGSTPPILERLRRCQCDGIEGVPLTLLTIPPQQYQTSRALNTAIASTRGVLTAILSQDAMPEGGDYLRRLVESFREKNVAGAYARQVLPPGVKHVIGKDLSIVYNAFPRVQTSPDNYFSNTCSILRRSLWKRHPFLEEIPLAEDHEWAKWAQEQGYVIHYRADVRVHHYHHYQTLRSLWRRYYDEGFSLGTIDRRALPLGAAFSRLGGEILSDRYWLIDNWRGGFSLAGRIIPQAWGGWIIRRTMQYLALYRGYRAGARAAERTTPPVRPVTGKGPVAIVCTYGMDVTDGYRAYLDGVLDFLRCEGIESVIASGGRTSLHPSRSEAGAMGAYLKEREPGLDVQLEEESLMTLHNLLYSRALLRNRWQRTVKVYICCDETRRLKVRGLAGLIFRRYELVEVVSIPRPVPRREEVIQWVSFPLQSVGLLVPPVASLLAAWKRRRIARMRRSAASMTQLF